MKNNKNMSDIKNTEVENNDVKATANKSKSEKSKYAGHRQRVKTQFLESGFDGWSQHRVLELLLFYSLPQGDVADLSRELIEKFGGSIVRVLEAPVDELLRVKRIQIHTVVLFKLILALTKFIGKLEFDTTTPIEKTEVAYQHLRPYFVGDTRECLRILCLDGNKNYLGVRTVGEGKLLSVGVDMRRLVQEALVLNTVFLYIAHGHVEGAVTPSCMDWSVTSSAIETLHSMELLVMDHLVIGRETYASMRKIAKEEKISLPWPV